MCLLEVVYMCLVLIRGIIIIIVTVRGRFFEFTHQYRIMEDTDSFDGYQNAIVAEMVERIEAAETMKERMLAVLDETLCCVAIEKISKKQAWLIEWAIEMNDAPFMQPAAEEPAESEEEVADDDDAKAKRTRR